MSDRRPRDVGAPMVERAMSIETILPSVIFERGCEIPIGTAVFADNDGVVRCPICG